MDKDRRIENEKGGWIPVLGNKQNKGIKIGIENLGGEGKSNRVNKFVPEDVSHRWIRNLFNKFGVVKDVFIPGKKSKVTGRLFAFVRYDCEVAAKLAISKVNGIWIEDRKLFVKMAAFVQNKDNDNIMGRNANNRVLGDKRKDVLMNQRVEVLSNENSNGFKTYAQAIKGFPGGNIDEKRMEERRFQEERKLVLKPEGNGWLFRSAVAKLHTLISIDELKVQMAKLGIDNILVRALGGRSVILTCNNKEDLGNLLKVSYLQRWFYEVKPWEGQAACMERFVWLCCYGIPLNGWSSNSFKAIGELWGSFISTDESTLRLSSFAIAKVLVATNVLDDIDEWINIEIEGKNYRVKVIEAPCDQPFGIENHNTIANLHVSQQHESEDSRIGIDNNKLVVHGSRLEKFAKGALDEVEKIEEVEETQCDKTVESPQLFELNPNKATESTKSISCVGKCLPFPIVPLSNYGVGPFENPIDDETLMGESKEDIDSFEDSAIVRQLENNMEDVDEAATSEDRTYWKSDESEPLSNVNHIPIQATIKGIKEKRNMKSINQILGYSRKNMGESKGKRNKKKCVVLRSAVEKWAINKLYLHPFHQGIITTGTGFY